jgi:hypothetical protein
MGWPPKPNMFSNFTPNSGFRFCFSMQLGYEQNTEELFMLYDAWEQLNMAQLEYFEILTKALQTQTEIDRLIERR